MSILVFQHVSYESAGLLGTVLRDYGHRLRVLSLWEDPTLPPDLDDIDGIISLGGPMNVDQADAHPWMAPEIAFLKQAHEIGRPIVGICLGAQLIAAALGGTVAAMPQPEVGWHNVKLAFPGTTDTIFQGIAWDTMQFHMHGQEVTQLPPGSTPLAGSKSCKNQAFKVGLRTFAFQYHFEWDAQMIRQMAESDMAKKAGATQAILTCLDDHYDTYRRRAARVADTMALTLFPIDKR